MKDEITGYEDKTVSTYQAAGVESEPILIIVPSGQTFTLTDFGNSVNDSAAWGAAEWNIYADGCPVRNFGPIFDQLGTPGQMRKIPPGFITASRDLRITMKNRTTYIADGSANASTFQLQTTIKGEYRSNA